MILIKTILTFAVFPTLAFFISICGGVEFGTRDAGVAALFGCVLGVIVAGVYCSAVSTLDV
jgi:hypothetical protein